MIQTTTDTNEILAMENGEVVGKIVFDTTPSEIVINQTFAYESGRGIGAILMEAAIAYAKETQRSIRPVCSYAVAYMEKHPL